MASETGAPPPEGRDPRKPSELGHVSFVQRLRRHFGPEVDPRINLQDEGDAASRKGEPDSRTPTSVEDFVKRLSPSLEAGGRYEIKEDVASGGMGTILRVWDGDLRRNLAMKVMHGRGSGSKGSEEGSGSVDPERLGRFLEEAQITGQLDHPGVVPVHDLGIDARSRCYFTMRFVRGRELKEVLDLARAGKEGWTRTKVLGVVLKVCEAMAYAHSKGVVHRDLKPANVMVGRFGETYVMDWGLARVLGRRDSHDLRLKPESGDASSMSLVRTVRRDESEQNPDSPLVTMDGDVIGTPSYMAPEQARGKLEDVGPRSDVYSLGAILYYMHTGQAPYVKPGERVSPHTVLSRVLDGPPVAVEKLAPHEPAELVAICAKAMARDPAQRYGSMLEVADDIQAFLENRVVRAYERGSLAEFKKWVVRNKGMAAGIAGMLGLGLAGAIFFGWQQRQENAALSRKENETNQAKEEAEKNLARAQLSEQEAKANLALAVERRTEADQQTAIARKNEEIAKRSGYAANVLAADYSLKLNEMAEARARLRATEDALRGWEWHHLDLKARAMLAELGSFTGVESLAFQPHENRAIIMTGQGRVILKDLATLREVPPDTITVASKDYVNTLRQLFSNLSLAVSPDGERIAIVGGGPRVNVFDLETGRPPPGVGGEGLASSTREGLGGAELREATSSAVAYSPNGRYLASGDDEGQILVRDALNYEILRRLSGHIAQITGIAWSPGSDRLATSSRDGSVRLWDLESGLALSTLRGHRGAVRAVAWDLTGQFLFSCGDDGAVHMWDVATGHLIRSFLGHEGPVHCLAFDPNQGRLVTGSSDRTVRLWDVDTGVPTVLRGHESAVVEVAFEADGSRILSGEEAGTVYLWDSTGDLSTTELVRHRASVSALAFDPSGKRLVTASEDKELVLWDAETCEPLRRLRGHANMVNSVVFSHDGRRILSGSHDQTAVLWDAETGAKLQTFGAFERWVEAALLTPDGTRVIVATGDKKVRVLEAATSATLHELAGYQYPAEELALSADGTRLATVGRDLMLWDLTGELEEPLFVRKGGRNVAAAISPDGTLLAAGSLTGQVQLWDATTGDLILEKDDQLKKIRAMVFSPDGRRLVTASDDGEIHVRDARSGATLLTLVEPHGSVASLAFSQDGTRLAAGMRDGLVRIYETGPAAPRVALRRAAAAVNEGARDLVERLFSERFRLDAVLAELQGDARLPFPVREAALRLAYLRGDDPLPLLRRSLEECLDAESHDEVYALALARADAAASIVPASETAAELKALMDLVRGIASYRNARFEKASEYLEQAPPPDEELHGLFDNREKALRLLFLCMAQCQTKRHHEAEGSWRLAQQRVLNDVELSQRAEMVGLLVEVETLVRTSASQAGS